MNTNQSIFSSTMEGTKTKQSICSSTIEGMKTKRSISFSTIEGMKTKRSICSATIEWTKTKWSICSSMIEPKTKWSICSSTIHGTKFLNYRWFAIASTVRGSERRQAFVDFITSREPWVTRGNRKSFGERGAQVTVRENTFPPPKGWNLKHHGPLMLYSIKKMRNGNHKTDQKSCK